MLLINKFTLSPSSFSLSNKRKRTPSIAPLLQRIKNSLFNNHNNPPNKELHPARRSNTVHCCLSEKQQDNTSVDSTLFYTNETKYYALRLERSIKDQKYVQKPMENWWSSSPPAQETNQHKSISMAC